VDDEMVDRVAVNRSFRELRIANPVVGARNGIKVPELLRARGGDEAAATASGTETGKLSDDYACPADRISGISQTRGSA
jgi:hypothetical protein